MNVNEEIFWRFAARSAPQFSTASAAPVIQYAGTLCLYSLDWTTGLMNNVIS